MVSSFPQLVNICVVVFTPERFSKPRTSVHSANELNQYAQLVRPKGPMVLSM